MNSTRPKFQRKVKLKDILPNCWVEIEPFKIRDQSRVGPSYQVSYIPEVQGC